MEEKNSVDETLYHKFDEYLQIFFNPESMQNMLLYMCNKCTAEVIDPIGSTLKLFISTPVVFAVTQLGLTPFKNCPMAIYPYTYMTKTQKQFILDYLREIQTVFAGRISTQLGGGCRIALSRKYNKLHHLTASEVLTQFCKAVFNNHNYKGKQTKLNICNIVLQRLGVSTGLSKETIQTVHVNVLKAYQEQAPDNLKELHEQASDYES